MSFIPPLVDFSLLQISVRNQYGMLGMPGRTPQTSTLPSQSAHGSSQLWVHREAVIIRFNDKSLTSSRKPPVIPSSCTPGPLSSLFLSKPQNTFL